MHVDQRVLRSELELLADVLVRVQLGARKEAPEIDGDEHGEQPVEVLQLRRVHVVRQPGGGALDDIDEGGAQVEPKRDDHGHHARGRVLERRRELLVVQRHLRREVQRLPCPGHGERQEQPAATWPTAATPTPGSPPLRARAPWRCGGVR